MTDAAADVGRVVFDTQVDYLVHDFGLLQKGER